MNSSHGSAPAQSEHRAALCCCLFTQLSHRLLLWVCCHVHIQPSGPQPGLSRSGSDSTAGWASSRGTRSACHLYLNYRDRLLSDEPSSSNWTTTNHVHRCPKTLPSVSWAQPRASRGQRCSRRSPATAKSLRSMCHIQVPLQVQGMRNLTALDITARSLFDLITL